MRYVSTRGRAPAVTFSQAAVAGLAPDGGLYIPEVVPVFSDLELLSMVGASYQRVAVAVLAKFAPEIPKPALMGICRKAFYATKFSHGVRGGNAQDIVPVIDMGEFNCYLAELSNGPTQAFKDLGMSFLAALMDYLKPPVSAILSATSGDTGSAAIHAFKDTSIPVFVLSPQEGMSRYQQVQMWGVESHHVHNLAIDAGFTTCQDGIVKPIFADYAFRNEFQLMAVNSINWARILGQIIYYVWVSLQMKRKGHQIIDVAVPSGNFGNAFAAYYARAMRIPIDRVVIATNENDILDRFFRTGWYERKPRVVTSSPSMDIEIASNLERLLYLVWQDPEKVENFYKDSQRADTGVFEVNKIVSGAIAQMEAHDTMKFWHNLSGIILDPHTAVAATAGWKLFRDRSKTNIPMVIIETAQPVKFRATINTVLGIQPVVPQGLDITEFEGRPTFEVRLPPDIEVVKRFIRKHI